MELHCSVCLHGAQVQEAPHQDMPCSGMRTLQLARHGLRSSCVQHARTNRAPRALTCCQAGWITNRHCKVQGLQSWADSELAHCKGKVAHLMAESISQVPVGTLHGGTPL